MQHATDRSSRSLRIRDEAEDRPATRRKIIAVCLLGAVAVHGALAFVPLNLGGTAAQYGVAPGDQIAVTLMVMEDEVAAGAEPAAALETAPPPAILDVAADMQPPPLEEEVIAPAPQVAAAAKPIQQPRPAIATASIAPKVVARTAGAGERTMAKPNYLRNPPPKYPAESRKLREEGLVLLKVLVTAEGRADDVQLQRSSGFARLDEAALKAVRRWEFNPARAGATPVACAVEVPVRFGLN